MQELLLIQNDWWEKNIISIEKAKPYKRKVFENIKNTYFNYRQILILTGLRRVGKTTLIYQLIQQLIENGVKPAHILYFSFDRKIQDPVEIFKEYAKITKVDFKNEKIYVFFDEIQKLTNWSSKIKLLYDNLPNLKICLSGSASLIVEKEAIKDLAGRYFQIEIKPLTLQEFSELYFNEKVDNFEIHRSKIESVFEEYISRPFPEIVKWKDKEKIDEYIRELVIEKIVRSDIPIVFKKVNLSLLSSLTEVFMKNIGMILNVEDMSKKFHVHKLTLSDHISYLEFGKLIKIVKNFRPSIMAESRKLPKVYPFNPALSLCFHFELNKGRIAENLVMQALNLNKYFREGNKEIDFLRSDKEILPIEVKTGQVDKQDIKNLLWFLDKYKLNKGIIIYTGEEEIRKFNSKVITFYPLIKLLFKFKLI